MSQSKSESLTHAPSHLSLWSALNPIPLHAIIPVVNIIWNISETRLLLRQKPEDLWEEKFLIRNTMVIQTLAAKPANCRTEFFPFQVAWPHYPGLQNAQHDNRATGSAEVNKWGIVVWKTGVWASAQGSDCSSVFCLSTVSPTTSTFPLPCLEEHSTCLEESWFRSKSVHWRWSCSSFPACSCI